MKTPLLKLLLLGLLVPLGAALANPAFNGRWRLDKERSSALDGWTAMDLILAVDGPEVSIGHDMRWRSTTRVLETNTVQPGQTVAIPGFFRVEQRHMAVYPKNESATPVAATWLDEGRTLRIEATVPVEISQGDAEMRLFIEYRLGVDDQTLTVIELHSTRNLPLVYRFHKLPSTDTSRP